MALSLLVLNSLQNRASAVEDQPGANVSTIEVIQSSDGVEYVFTTNYRSTAGIVTSCLSTILLCTWFTVHPNICGRQPTRWQFLRAKLTLFAWALIMPEAVMMHACNQWFGAREIAKRMGPRWSVVEGHFLQMGGYLLHHDGQYEYPYLGIGAVKDSSLCPPTDRAGMENTQTKIRRAGYHKLRTLHDFMTKQEIQDKSKSDGLAKLVVLVQTAWFTGQCLARVVQKLAITELEIITLAYTALNGVMHFFWWNKPLDVQFPLVIEVNLPQDQDNISEVFFRTPSPSLPHEILEDNEKQLVAETHYSSPDPGESSGDSEPQLVAETHYSSPDPGESSQFTQQVLPVRARLGRFTRAQKAWGRCLSVWHTASSEFGRWWHIVTGPVNRFLIRRVLWLAGAIRPVCEGHQSKLGNGYFAYMPPLLSRRPLYYLAGLIVSLFASLFGAIHFISLSFPFPTPVARSIWRIFSMYLTFSPLIMVVPVLGGLFRGNNYWYFRLPRMIVHPLVLFSSLAVMLYVTARITLVVVAFWGLSCIPASGHISIEWSDFIPHI